jgi:hypothetical protein
MTPVHQTVLNSTRGNCFSACVASLLNVPCDDVPIIHDYGDGWFSQFNGWMRERHGKALLMVRHRDDAFWLPDGVPFIASVDSPRGGWRHAVVVEFKAGVPVVLHDPHPDGDANANSPHFYYFLVPCS